MSNLKVVMSSNIQFCNVDDSLISAYRKMRAKQIRHLPVLDQDQLIGVLSDRDIQRAVRTDIRDVFSAGVIETTIDERFKVRDFMSWPAMYLQVSEDLRSATQMMIDNKLNSLVVVDGEEVVGIVTSEDLLKVLFGLLNDQDLSLQDRLVKAAMKTPLGKLSELLANSGI